MRQTPTQSKALGSPWYTQSCPRINTIALINMFASTLGIIPWHYGNRPSTRRRLRAGDIGDDPQPYTVNPSSDLGAVKRPKTLLAMSNPQPNTSMC